MLKIKNLKNVLTTDKHFVPEQIEEILKSEVFKCLNNYLEIKSENVISSFHIDQNGDFEFSFKINAKRIKIMGILPREV